jgi:transcriptional regulator with GAF, ATPase, and Fis domain
MSDLAPLPQPKSLSRAQRARDRLQLLLDLNNRVVSKLKLRDVLREISANIRTVMECDGVAITLPGPEDQKLRVYALDFPGNPTDIEEGFEPLASEEPRAATVFQTGETVILSREELQQEPFWRPFGFQSLALVPLKGNSGSAGSIAKFIFEPFSETRPKDGVRCKPCRSQLGVIAAKIRIVLESPQVINEMRASPAHITREVFHLRVGRVLYTRLVE